MTLPPSSPERQRGAQPGNTNALKHGFYARRVPELQDASLEALDTEFPGLEEEILVMRVYIRRMLEQCGTYATLPVGLAIMRTLTLAMGTLARLIREHRYLTEHPTDTFKVLRQSREDIAAVEDPIGAFEQFSYQYASKYGQIYLEDVDFQEAYRTSLELMEVTKAKLKVRKERTELEVKALLAKLAAEHARKTYEAMEDPVWTLRPEPNSPPITAKAMLAVPPASSGAEAPLAVPAAAFPAPDSLPDQPENNEGQPVPDQPSPEKEKAGGEAEFVTAPPPANLTEDQPIPIDLPLPSGSFSIPSPRTAVDS